MAGKLGVLALQGAFREHREALSALSADVIEVRRPDQLDAVDAVVLPGGESTTMSKLLHSSDLRGPLADRLRDGLPVLGTCAGLILLAREVLDADQVRFNERQPGPFENLAPLFGMTEEKADEGALRRVGD